MFDSHFNARSSQGWRVCVCSVGVRWTREQLVSIAVGGVKGKLGLNVQTQRQNTNEIEETSAVSCVHKI